MAQKKTKFDWRFLFLLPIPLLWAFLGHFGYLQFLENRLLDLRFRARGEIAAPVKLIYVDLDTQALQLLGERPWNREKFGLAAKTLLDNGRAKAVGFDLVFSALGNSEIVDQKKAQDGNVALARVVRDHPGVVLAAQYTQGWAMTQADSIRQLPLIRKGLTDRSKNDVPEMPQYPIVTPRWGRIGLIDFDTEYGGDEVPRWVPLFVHTPNPTLYHLSLQLVLQSLDLDERAVRLAGDRLDVVRPDGSLVRSVPLYEQQLLEVNWFSHWQNSKLNPRVSLADVLSAQRQLTSDKPSERADAELFLMQFADAIVLIGPTDVLLQDLAPTPFDAYPVPKVGVHGNLIKTLLSGRFLHHAPEWVMWGTVLLLTAAVSGLSVVSGRRGILTKIGAGLLFCGYVGLCLHVFKSYDLVLPMSAPLSAALSTSFIGVVWQLIVEEKQKGRIKGMFGTYLSPELVNRMVESAEDPKLGGHEEVITAYFSDIQSFSSFSEMLPPDRLVELMNEYLTACTDIVQEEGGTLDKYIGDAVVAIYGAPIALPDHAYRACVATQRAQLRIAALRDQWRGESGRWPEVVHNLRARIGLNTGPAIIGNMGSRSRFSYTMMGDNVNLAARMESGAKSWAAYTMCTEATKVACEQHGGDRVVFRSLGRIVVMGRSQPVPVYEITGLREHLAPPTLDCLGLFEQGLANYYARDWDGAIKFFQQSSRLEPLIPGRAAGVKSNPSLVYLEICEQFKREPPPENWDGVYVMKEK